MALMKQLLISFTGGLLLFCVWIAIVVLTSQDFKHEGPNSIWFSPVDASSQFLIDIGWTQHVSSLRPILRYPIQVTAILGPFIFILSAVVYLVIWLFRKKVVARKLS